MRTHCLQALFGLATLLGLSACSDRSDVQDAGNLQLAAGTDSPICRLFTTNEIGTALGSSVDAGHASGPLGSGCSWPIKGRDRSVMIQIVPRDYWEDGTAQPGAEALEGVGEKAFVGPWLDDQRAGALTGNGALYVMSPSRQTSVALLHDLAQRAHKSFPEEGAVTSAGEQ